VKIYTKTGDHGETSLFGGKRVPKDSPRIETYGTVDELNAEIGVTRALKPKPDLDTILGRIQNLLFVLGAELSSPRGETRDQGRNIGTSDVEELERAIDGFEKDLTPLRNFILPGGSSLGAQLHVARTVCRRAERLLAGLARTESLNPHCLIFLNRLSDLLFVMARRANRDAAATETLWKP